MAISIIIYAEHIERTLYCMNSIQLHTRLAYELIVINELLDENALDAYRDTPNVRVLNWSSSLSIMEGFKRAASMTEGDIIVFVYDYIAMTTHWDEDFISAFHQNHRLAMLSPTLNTELDLPVHANQANPLNVLNVYARGIRSARSRGIVSTNAMERAMICVNKRIFMENTDFMNECHDLHKSFSAHSLRLADSGYETAILQDCMVINTTPFTEKLTMPMEHL